MNDLERDLLRLGRHVGLRTDFADVNRRAQRIRRRRMGAVSALGVITLVGVIGLSRASQPEATAQVIVPQPSDQLTTTPRPDRSLEDGSDQSAVETTIAGVSAQTLPSITGVPSTIGVITNVATSRGATPSTSPFLPTPSTTPSDLPTPAVTELGTTTTTSTTTTSTIVSSSTTPPPDAPLMSEAEATDTVLGYFDALAGGQYAAAAVLLGQGGLEESERPDLAHLYPESPRDVSRSLADRLQTWCINRPADCQSANIVLVEAIPYTYRATVELGDNQQSRWTVLVTWFEGYLGVQWPTRA